MKPNYFALINAMIFLLFSNNFIHGETQRKLQSDENYWKYFENYDGVWPNDLPYENYMILYYGQEVEYTFGYSNEFRKDISFIMNGDINKTETDPLNIAAGTKIEIYFSSPPKSFESFFDRIYDENVEYITSVDLSHLDLTVTTSFAFMFYQCFSLKSVIPPKIPSLKLVTMESMFEGCTSMISFFISNYYTKSVTNMDSLLSNCKSMKVIDLSNGYFDSIESANYLFHGLENIKFIDYRSNNEVINEAFYQDADLLDLIVINRINVCPGDSCCKFDFETGKCNLTAASYVTLYYGKDANYSRFKSKCEDCLRNIIALKIGDSEISLTQSFEVKKGNKLEIYFSSYPLNTLSYFLDGYIEIISADFSHFDASNIEEIVVCFMIVSH